MPGIYIHIPFCRQACHYCDFHFSTSLKSKSGFLSALKNEIVLQKNFLHGEVSTVYFGGGTPSLLSKEEMLEIFTALEENFNISPSAELTLEANPDDLTEKKLSELAETPVNRLSIGVQSFFDDDLRFLNRSHDAAAAIASVKNAQAAGFKNITIDLIYGIQTLTNVRWKENIEHALALDVPHISCYSLTVEPRTALQSFITNGKIKNISAEQSAEQFEILMHMLEKNGFVHYEISNFGREGFFSRHNSSYWRGGHYLGLGPSAHSYDGNSRQWNVRSNTAYIAALKQNKIPCEKEMLTAKQKYNEYVMTTLRTIWGTDLDYVKKTFGKEMEQHLIRQSEKYVSLGQLEDHAMPRKLFLTPSGKLFADRIASDLFAE